jgi:hypothetical protein
MNILVLILIVFNLVNSFKLSENGVNQNVIEGEKIKEKLDEKTSLRSDKSDARDTRWSYFYMGQWTWHFPLW